MTKEATAAVSMLCDEAERRKDLYALLDSLANCTDEELGQMALLSLDSNGVEAACVGSPLLIGGCMRLALGAVMREREAIRRRENN